MPDAYRRTYRANGEGANALDVSIEYQPQGVDLVTGKTQPQGYYLVIQPVNRKGDGNAFVPFAGRRTCVLECDRQSTTSYVRAKAIMDTLVEQRLTSFCRRENIDVDDSEYEERELELSR